MALNTGINSLDEPLDAAADTPIKLEGQQQAGGPYNQGSDVKNALAVWSNMGPEDRAGFDGFLDFFRTGAWRDQIQGMRQMERDRRTASAPDPQDEMNSFSLREFGKPLHQLTPEETQELYDLAREQAAGSQERDTRTAGTYTQRRRTQMAGGGIMGSNAGSMLVAPTADGSRPGYAWYDKFII